MIVSLNRWEWNRALFFGLIVLIAEVGLATALILRKLGHLEHRSGADPATLATLRSTRPPSPDRFEWLKESARGQDLNVFITFLVAGGVLLSGVAWVVDQLGSRTSTPIGERAPGGEAGPDQLPGRRPGRRRRHRPRPGHPRRRRRADPQAPGPLRPRSVMIAPGRLALGAVGLAVGVLGTIALREATLSTHEAVEPGSTVDVVVSARSEGRRARADAPGDGARPSCSPAGSRCTPTSPARSATRETAGSGSRSNRRPTRPTAASSEAAWRTGRSTSSGSTWSRSRRAARETEGGT